MKEVEVYGSPDSNLVKSYNNDFEGESTSLTISRMKTVFPSELEIHHEDIFTVGGLILVKLKRKSEANHFKGEVRLRYRTLKGDSVEQSYPISFEFHPTEQFFSEECLRSAI